MNILIVRTSALGDIVHAMPVLRALRRALPEARLGWVVESVFAPLLEGHPDLDAVFPVKMRGWRRRLMARETRREIGAARRALRGFAADLALDLMGNHKAGAIARLSGARRILGPSRADRREPSSAIWIHQGVSSTADHAVDRALEILGPLDLPPGPIDFGGDLLLRAVPPEAEAFLQDRAPYITIQAGAGWGNKTYPPSFWGEVAWRLYRETGLDVWVPIAPGEAHLAEGVAAASRGAARTVDAASFFFLAALLRRSRLLLGGDTGPLHLAHALGVPVVCVMGPTDPRRHGPHGHPEQAVFRQLPCSFCYKRFAEAKACLLQLTPSDVVARSLEILRCIPPRSPQGDGVWQNRASRKTSHRPRDNKRHTS